MTCIYRPCKDEVVREITNPESKVHPRRLMYMRHELSPARGILVER